MSVDKIKRYLPAVATRGIVLFPNQEIVIEVGRPKSVNAVEEAEKFFNGHVLLVSQKDVMTDEPHEEDLFEYGTLAFIKEVKRKVGFLRVTFTGVQRAKIDTLTEDSQMLFSNIEVLDDIVGDPDEEAALIRTINKEIKSALSSENNPRMNVGFTIPKDFWDSFVFQSMSGLEVAD